MFQMKMSRSCCAMMSRRSQRKMAAMDLAWALLYVLAITSAAQAANTYTWTNGDAANSYWSTGGNWSPTGPPALADDAIVSPGVLGGNGAAVVNTGTASVTNLDVQKNILGNLGEVDLQAGTTLSVNAGDLTNDGLIVVNSNAGTTGGRVLFSAFAGDFLNTLSGTGTIRLQSGSQTFPTAITAASVQSSGSVVTQQAGHTIRGVGLVSASMVNNGSILADDMAAAPGSNTLELSGPNGMTNNGTLGAESGGTLDIVGTYTISQGAGGVIQAVDGGTVLLRNTLFITGGTLQTKGSGIINNSSGSTRLTDVTNAGTYQISSPATTFVGGSGLTNDGEIHGFGALNFLASGVLDGTGALVLGGAGSLAGQAGVVVTQAASHTISGSGTVSVELINNGVVQAESGTLSLLPNPVTNNNELRAASGGTLAVRSQITQDTSTGLILAEDGGTVKLGTGSRVTNGTLESQGSGLIRAGDGAYLRDVVNQATLQVQPDTSFGTLNIEGAGLTNDGSIVVNPSASAAVHYLQFVGDPQMSLSGSGNVDLNGVNTIMNVDVGVTLTNEAGHTIDGIGTIQGTLINEGSVEGDSISNPMRITGNLSGTGGLQNVRISGTHAPGNGGPATANVTGLYEITAGGKFQMEVGGTTFSSDYDYVDVTGTAHLAGTLEVDLINGYLPAPNTGIPIVLTTGGVTGTFTNEILPDLYGGLYYDVEYEPYQVSLAVKGLLGDYNQNGVVDAADYTVWRDTLGSTTDLRANGDNTGASMGIIDEADFDFWRANFGMVAPGAGAGAGILSTVPEPTSLVLWLMAVVLLSQVSSASDSTRQRWWGRLPRHSA
jgi:hypothetical protein